VQSLCSELAQGRFTIKEALKQLNVQKAIDVFLNMWNNVTGIARINVPVPGSTTNEVTPETDDQYRQRLLDSVFWDKISNLALKKTLLLKLGYDSDVLDIGTSSSIFREVPELSTKKYQATFGSRFIPYSTPGYTNIELFFARSGPSSKAKVHDNGSTGTESSPGTLSYYDYDWDFEGAGYPTQPATSAYQWYYGPYGSGNFLYFSAPLTIGQQPPGADDFTTPELFIDHQAISSLYNQGSSSNSAPGDPLFFFPSGASGILVNTSGGVLTFELYPGSPPPQELDWVMNWPKSANWLLTSSAQILTSGQLNIRPKLLSNIYSVTLPVGNFDDAKLNEIYEEISPLAALGNVLLYILQDIILDLEDWDTAFGNIPYGPIFFGGETQSGIKSTASNWAVDEEIYMDNQKTLDEGDIFYGNDTPDDIVVLKRIT
jgi:hypothetical protein